MARATALGVPRYTSVARLLAHRARRALGLPVDLEAVAADLDLLDRAVASRPGGGPVTWPPTSASPGWLDRAADRAARLARNAGELRGRAAAGAPTGGCPARSASR